VSWCNWFGWNAVCSVTSMIGLCCTASLEFQGDLDVYSKTASKYDDCRLLHLPNVKLRSASSNNNMSSERCIICCLVCSCLCSFKVVDFSGKQKGLWDFLFVVNSKCSSSLHRFWDIASYWLKIVNFCYAFSFNTFSIMGDLLRIFGKVLQFLKLEFSGSWQ